MTIAKALLLAAAVASASAFTETRIKMEDLPPAVRTAVGEQTRNATVVGLSRETENRRTLYEVETRVNGKSRDLLFDKTGAVVEVEEEVDLASIPAAARAAIEKRAAGATVRKVETLARGSRVSYEATLETKSGKRTEIAVNADGSPHK